MLSHPDRCLLDHLKGVRDRSLEKFERVSSFIDWERVFGFSKEDVKKTLEVSAILHDIGKATEFFQKKVRGERSNSRLSRHAPLSAFYTVKVLKELGINPFLIYVGYSLVRFHHTGLKTPLEEERPGDLIEKQLEGFDASIVKDLGFDPHIEVDDVLNTIEDVSFDAQDFGKIGYFLLKILFSILVSSDREDVVLKGEKLDVESVFVDMVDEYISNLPKRTDIDDLRSAFQSEVRNFKEDGGVFTISAPTGIGKTLANFRLALSVRESKDGIVVYSLPLINIIEQTADVARKVFGDGKVLEYHHLAEPDLGDVPDEKYMEFLRKYEIASQTWSYPIVITTFVSLLESLIGGSKAPFLHRLPGGTVVLDEVQSIPHEKWGIVKEIIEFLPKIGVKVIVSTATMPSIFEGVEVVKRKDYFEKLSRVKFKFEREMELEKFKSWINEMLKDGKSTLIIANTIKSAEEIFDSLNTEACFLSSRVLPIHRRERIESIKRGDVRVCVSTQVIEAGVDVSFERVIRDIAPVDSIVQAGGRCNRNFEFEFGEVIIVPLLEDGRYISKRIYGKFLVDKTLEFTKGLKEIEEKDFNKLVIEFFKEIEKFGGIDEYGYIDALEKLNVSKLDEFRLIEDTTSYSFLVLIDDEARKLFETLIERSKNLSGVEKALFVKNMIRKLSPYTVSTAVYEKENVGAFETAFGMAVIRDENVENWYDPVKGLRLRSGEVFI